jgi:hypothetical protein
LSERAKSDLGLEMTGFEVNSEIDVVHHPLDNSEKCPFPTILLL